MRKNTNWKNPATIKIVKREISKSPDNLKRAFEKIANRLNATENSVAQAWYSKIRFNHPEFATGSDKTVIVNGKNSRRKFNKKPLREVVDVKKYDGLKVVITKQYFVI